jgi:uncharacterized protein YjgD (DUF1641 family)
VFEMSDTQQADVPDELTAAIRENPDAVATFIDRLDAVNELLEVIELGENALDDEMVSSISRTAGPLIEAADDLATDQTVELATTVGNNGAELNEALETLLRLQRTGTLEELVEIAEVASLLTAALNDEMVQSVAGTGTSIAELADTAAGDDTRQGLESVLIAVGEAEREGVSQVGPLGLVRATRDEEVQAGLGYMLVLAKALGRSAQEKDHDESG